MPSSKSTYDDICKTHNEKLSFGCTRCNFLVCQKCYEDELLIEEECASDGEFFWYAVDIAVCSFTYMLSDEVSAKY